MQQRIEWAEREQTGAGERAEPALAARLEEKRMERAGGGEAKAEAMLEGAADGVARGGPVGLAASVVDERIERGLGALKCERHAVAGERRDQAVSVAEGNRAGNRGVGGSGKTQRGDGAEGSGVGFRLLEPIGERGEAAGPKIRGQEGVAGGVEAALTEEAAEVDLVVFDRGEADVAIFAEVNFEIAGEAKTACVDFQTDPSGVAAASAGGEDAAGRRREIGGAGRGAEIAAGSDEGLGEAGVEGVTAESEGGGRELLDAREFFVVEPRDLAMAQRVAEKGLEAEPGDRGGVEAGDEFAADAVARIAAGFEQCDGNSLATECEAQ